jgi:hypothetical protein
MLLWKRTTNVEKDWDDLKNYLNGRRLTMDDVHPLIINRLWVGDNFYTCESHSPEAFGMWIRKLWNSMHGGREEDQVSESA